ncbi:hypothetical protein NKH77_41060 [Streptomyces sp. M19]
MDEALDAIAGTTDLAKQKPHYFTIEREFIKDMPVIPLFYAQNEQEFNGNRVTGYPTADDLYAAPSIWLDPDGGWVAARVKPVSGGSGSRAAMRYLLRKLGFYLVAAWMAVTVNFFLPRLIPGDPVQLMLARQSQSGPVQPGQEEALAAMLGLGHGNLAVQYGSTSRRWPTSTSGSPSPTFRPR